jgi:hypothetical protein
MILALSCSFSTKSSAFFTFISNEFKLLRLISLFSSSEKSDSDSSSSEGGLIQQGKLREQNILTLNKHMRILA